MIGFGDKEMEYIILAINPGSTSTKLGLFLNDKELARVNIPHANDEIEQFDSILQQVPMRKKVIADVIREAGYDIKSLSIVMGRGGMLPPIKTGGYLVNDLMLDLILKEKIPSHASNLGAVLAHSFAQDANVKAYIYDAVSASDFPPIAKITGIPEIRRNSFYHVLNSRAVGIRYAHSIGRRYEDMNLIVAHLGGGITAGAHQKGRIVDSISDDNGPFAPERAGSVPLLEVINMCYGGEYSKQEMFRKVRGMGGLRALLGTSDAREIHSMIESGNEYARLVMDAQAYQIAKGIALMSPALHDGVDTVILTGGLAHYDPLVEKTKEFISWLAPIAVIPGEYEIDALAEGGLRILRGEEAPSELTQADIS
jgi:butyrate kinase